MESERFDALIRTLANESTRRGAIGLLTGVVGLGLEEVAAKGKAKGKSRDKPRKRRGGGNGEAHAKTRHDTGGHNKDRGKHHGSVADEKKKRKKTICHCGSSNPASCQTIRIKKKAAKKHLRTHPFDAAGACPNTPNTTPPPGTTTTPVVTTTTPGVTTTTTAEPTTTTTTTTTSTTTTTGAPTTTSEASTTTTPASCAPPPPDGSCGETCVLPDSSGNNECGVNCRHTASTVDGTVVCSSPQCGPGGSVPCSVILANGLNCTSSAECQAKPGYECSDCINDPIGGCTFAFCAKRCKRETGFC